MTITLVPDDPNPRRLDLGPKHRPHSGPYYGEQLRRVIASEKPKSKRDRDAHMAWLIVAIVVPAAVLAAALIVSYAR